MRWASANTGNLAPARCFPGSPSVSSRMPTRSRSGPRRISQQPVSFGSSSSMFSLVGKGALVNGATGGIGNAIARALHEAGATVAISGTKAERLEALAGDLKERVHILPCNLADRAAVQKLPAPAQAKGGTPDGLV